MRRVSYDAQAQSLDIELDGHSVRVTGLAEARFTRHAEGAAPDQALWVTAEQAGVLVKMIEYILGRVKITDSSRAALEVVLPRAREAAAASEVTAPAEASSA
jgi:hypothetical protein